MAISEEYQNYLDSTDWKQKRLKVLNRAKFTCENCGQRQATQIHHKTYEHIFNERLNDLQALCAKCHMDVHGIKPEKKRRKTKFFGRVKRAYKRFIW